MPSGGEGCGSMQAGGGAAPELLGPASPAPGPPEEALPGGEREAPGHWSVTSTLSRQTGQFFTSLCTILCRLKLNSHLRDIP